MDDSWNCLASAFILGLVIDFRHNYQLRKTPETFATVWIAIRHQQHRLAKNGEALILVSTISICHIRPKLVENTGSRPLSHSQAAKRWISSWVGDDQRIPGVVCSFCSFCSFCFSLLVLQCCCGCFVSIIRCRGNPLGIWGYQLWLLLRRQISAVGLPRRQQLKTL